MSTIEKLRLFVAVTVPEYQIHDLEVATKELRRKWDRARWLPSSNQHLTLKFLGSTPSDRLGAVREVIATAARSHEPADVSLGGLGAFPSARRARVLWAGIDDTTGLLAGLARDLEQGFEPLGFRTEKRRFTPHLTLARFKTPAGLGDLPDVAPMEPFTVDRLVLFRSRLHPQGARYEALDEARLEAP